MKGLPSGVGPTVKIMQILFRGLLPAVAFVFAGCASHQAKTRVAFPQASINGRPANLLLDTGSESSVLFDARARRLGLKSDVISEPTPVTIGRQTFTAPIPIFSFPWYFRPAFSTMKSFAIDGLVGWPEIRDNILIFDSERRMVRSADQLPPETADWLKVKVVPGRWLLLEIPLAEGQKGLMQVDTGSPWAIEVSPGEWKEWKAAYPRARLTWHIGGVLSYGLGISHVAWADEIKLGALTLTDVAVQNMPAAEAADIRSKEPASKAVWAIGMYVLMRMDLIVDGKTGFAYLHPKPPPGPPYPGVKRPGARHVTANTPGAGGNWTVSESLHLCGDSLFVLAGEYEQNKNDFAGALDDFKRALELNPENAEAFSGRGETKASQGDEAGALADYDHALELDPSNAEAYSRRGAVREIQGDFSNAFSDFNKAIELKPEDSDYERLFCQTLLWRLDRTPENAPKTVAAFKGRWTKTIGLFLTGALDEKSLLKAAKKSDVEPVSGQICEAFYYIGMMRLSRGDKAAAYDAFLTCRAFLLKDYDEYQFAGAELARLDAGAR
jgi:tetratricopeptide (TPR) repeat protein